MVKFGGHVEAIREGDLVDARLYIIPYNEIKSLVYEDKGSNISKSPKHAGSMKTNPASAMNLAVGNRGEGEKKQADSGDEVTEDEEQFFMRVWKVALSDAEEDFRGAREEIWQTIFAGITEREADEPEMENDPPVRGAHPGNAIKLYVDRLGETEAQELLVRMKEVYRAASINSEGLRKLVKKSDKHRKDRNGLSSKLLPLLYTSSLYTGQNMMQDAIGLLRDLICGRDSDSNTNGRVYASDDSLIGAYNDGHFSKLVKRNSETRHQEAIDIRKMEFDWLKSLVRSIPPNDLLPKLVAHRGFHHTKDRNDKRPVENSLSAYEMAWTCGIELCECDIALTKDEKLILAHDENFERLSLDALHANSKRKVGDLTFKELISMPLSNGVRPPLLIDVLRSASAISERSKLVIEIKPGNESSAFALARLLTRHPDLRSNVAMIMSFDAATMHQLRAELDRVVLPDSRGELAADRIPLGGAPLQNSNTHRRVTSYDHFGTLSSGWLAGMGMGAGSSPVPLSSQTRRRDGSIDLSSIGLSISQTNLAASPSSQSVTRLGKGFPSGSGQLNGATGEPLATSGSWEKQAVDHYGNSFSMPKLMLLTVADPPSIPCELQVQYNELHRVDSWLRHEDGFLDGVYLQYEPGMLTPEGAACLRELSQRFLVGIWGYAERDPDDFETFEWLVKEGNCSFVNSDLPKHFRKELLIQKERLPPRYSHTK
ncbi:unnamed protein product [Pseudo-nitzschia multistriata]|uniref:GP-PDE domain-containing protein n=1 Tax=Pseudo-nitzschia multistriata TaxID=183589 RepID=A0A448Z2V3_9STRA|nr:unnamed protein product [Pseudo-nitzschia multistriata]